MHIAIDARAATSHFPGVGRYVRGLIGGLEGVLRPGHSVSVLENLTSGIAEGGTSKEIDETPFSLLQQLTVRRALGDLRAEVYHTPYYSMPYSPGVPTVLTVHDLIPMRVPQHVTARARYLFPVLMRLALHAADRVIVPSESTRRDLVELFDMDATEITVSGAAIDNRFSPAPPVAIDRLRKRYGLPEHFTLYLGTNKPHKNLVGLVEAWSLVHERTDLASWKLVIAGRWDPRYPSVLNRVRQLRLDEQVLFLGPIEEPDLPALYSAADLFVYPSLYEGFGFPVLEALACGVPVACSATSSLPEVAGAAARYFDPTDAEDVASVLLDLMNDDSARNLLRQAAADQVSKFSWQETALRTLSVYESLYSETVGQPA
jgi:glycosyltransferase involved in cell wall biosynthesis